MTEAKDLLARQSYASTTFHPAYSKLKKSRKCSMYCNPSKDDEPLSIDVHVQPDCENSKSPEEFYAQGICELTGTENKELAEYIIWLGTLAICGKENPREKNIVFQSLAEQQPNDAHEARLCTQAMALYVQGMKCLKRSEQEDRIIQCEFYMKNAQKLLRLHNETVEAINRHRRGGEQRVVVQHVQVNEGGKAVVGGVFEGGGV